MPSGTGKILEHFTQDLTLGVLPCLKSLQSAFIGRGPERDLPYKLHELELGCTCAEREKNTCSHPTHNANSQQANASPSSRFEALGQEQTWYYRTGMVLCANQLPSVPQFLWDPGLFQKGRRPAGTPSHEDQGGPRLRAEIQPGRKIG